MNKLTVSVTKILGVCSGTPPVKKGDYFTIRNGDIRIPDGQFVCAWALQNILPLIPAKERKICESRAVDWMWRVHHVQCPDPNGRVVFKIEKGVGRTPAQRLRGVREAGIGEGAVGAEGEASGRRTAGVDRTDQLKKRAFQAGSSYPTGASASFAPRRLRIVVDEVKGKCTSGLEAGDAFHLDGCHLTIPPGHHFCLYALQAVLPFIAAKQRRLEKGDWLERDDRFICPDPAGNVILRIQII